MCDDIFFDEQGRFQMAADELDDFVRFLLENKIGCEVDAAETFLSEGRAFAFGRLRYPFDTDETQALYRTWRQLRESQSPA